MKVQPMLAPCLPPEGATCVGRAWTDDGPCVVTVREDTLVDVTPQFPTVSGLLDMPDPVAALAGAHGTPLGSLAEVLAHSPCLGRAGAAPALLAPCDLQAIKACGVTFMVSLMERLIEERAGGDAVRASALRGELLHGIAGDLRAVRPGSGEASRLRSALIARGMWSPYLEVAIGPDAEVFTKAQPLSAVGHGMDVGVRRDSRWSNPEPEVVLVVNRRGVVVGATLGNDVNLRDVEGRSALLLGQAKDNNGACAIGPFIRLFDTHAGGEFDLDAVRRLTVTLRIEGPDGFVLEAESPMTEISRDPAELVRQATGPNHHYPDGLMLFLGTMFAPVADRDTPGQGFTHRPGDLVTISAPALGRLVNRIGHCDAIAPWNFGTGDLMRNLAGRGLLSATSAR